MFDLKTKYTRNLYLRTQYTGNLSWLVDNTIFLTKHGSHAYGTNIPTSDLDIRGICIAPKEYYMGFNQVVEQVEQKEPDMVIFEIRKFLKLACDANPNVLELLFTDPLDHLSISPAGQLLLDNRELFLTKRVKYTFQGYAFAQLKRINSHRKWLLAPVETPPTRKEFGLPERTVLPQDQLMAAQAAIQKKMDEWGWNELESVSPDIRISIQEEFVRRLTEITTWKDTELSDRMWEAAGRSIGLDTNFLELMGQERKYQSKMKEYRQYQEWKKNRNQARAAIEAEFGLDLKHAMHLTRLSRCCLEILTEGKLNVKRHDAQDLLDIRNGKYSFEQLMEMFEQKNREIEEAFEKCTLPASPDRNKIDNLCISIVEDFLKKD